MKRILFSHFHHDEYLGYKRILHEISTEFTVSNVECGDKLFNLLKFFTPDLLVIDVCVKSNDSAICFNRLITEEKFSSLKVLVHSDGSKPAFFDELTLSGNCYHLVKPFTKEHFRRKIEDALSEDWAAASTQPVVKYQANLG